MNYFTFAGKSSQDFGIFIDENTTYNAAVREYETAAVPGRNGDLTIDSGRYSNVDVGYKCNIGNIGAGFKANMNAFKAFLLSNVGYKRLEDTYQPDSYRLARVRSAPDPETFRDIAGAFEVVFDCKPQRFLKSGETAQTFTSSGTLVNPTPYTALPLIRVYGTGTLRVGSTTVVINSANTYTDLDCDIQDAFKGSTNCNGNITLSSGDFPTLPAGSTGISFSGISKVEVTPRWWTL